MSRRIDVGYVALLDAAPLVVAAEMGFAAEEGLTLALHRESSWATLRDRLLWGGYDAAQMLAPVVVAQTAGLGPGVAALDALMVLSVNGDMIGAAPALAAAIDAGGGSFLDAAATRRALLAATAGAPLRFGVPFPLSTHAALVDRWLGAGPTLVTVPPARMAAAIEAGAIDAFCVGEPWGSVAVELGAARLVLPGAAIWQFAPEKMLAVSRATVDADPERAAALMRAVWRAARWLGDPANAMTAAEIVGAPQHLDVAPEILERCLSGRLVVDPDGREVRVPRAIEFFAGAASFPWRSQALWFADWLARTTGADRTRLRAAARASFRPDVFRRVLGPVGADLPGASEKLEGAMANETAVASTLGTLLLGPDRFFDGAVFDPVGD
ncbi:MAG TPA: CmpA/NrtA family ABC transporter substrate-binding protein [Amaricoccus sp.]|nr:CmpA/NrtA family ABC transporter substrate-binding protein [Amaricoccus sp.]